MDHLRPPNFRTLKVASASVPAEYPIRIGSGLLSGCGEFVRSVAGQDVRTVAIISNKKVFTLYGERVLSSLESSGIRAEVWLMQDGERFKNMRSLESALGFFSRIGLARTDCVVALGGGVVGDLSGFAAAVHLRGIRFIQVPTTLLAMIDSSVGGKTGVNTAFGKNLAGAFHQPAGVLVDTATLRTLPRRELTAGFCEAVKHGAIASRELLDQTGEFLDSYPPKTIRNVEDDEEFDSRLADLLFEQISFKVAIVAGDPFESADRTDRRSRKILNFGHTLAHALEKLTKYRYFKHGEAVGYGILFAAKLSKKLEIFGSDDLELLNDVLHRCGRLPSIKDISAGELAEAFKFDKKNIADSLQFILLKGIGDPVVVSEKEIPLNAVKETLKNFLKEY